MSKFQKIDELTIDDHFFLDLAQDSCWYMFNYTANVGFTYSDTNSLISNLKKDVSLKGTPQYQHKTNAINKVAGYFSNIKCDKVTFVPIPPSKNKADPLYDDRIYQILQLAYRGNANADVRELVLQTNSTVAAHITSNRPTIQQIEQNITIDTTISANLRGTIFLVDDVLTTGAHFVAIKNVIKRAFPDIHVVGLFICRRAI